MAFCDFVFNDGSPTLYSLRHLTTYSLLAALLFGNVAGWVHVGCHGSGHHRVAPQSEPAAHSCCCHHHCAAPTAKDEGSKGSDSESDDSAPADEHDSDHCSVCQGFFASRHSAILIGDVIVWTPAFTGRLSFERDDALVKPIFLSGLSVRGPPSV